MTPDELLYNTMTVRELASFQRRFNVLWQTIFNGAAVASKRRLQIDQADFYIGLRVQPGRRVVLFDRILKFTVGRFAIDILSGAWVNNPTSEDFVVAPLRNTGAITLTADVVFDVTPSGTPIVVEEGFDQAPAGSPQSKNAASLLNVEGAVKVFEGGETGASAMLRMRRIAPAQGQVEPYDFNVQYIAWEEPLE